MEKYRKLDDFVEKAIDTVRSNLCSCETDRGCPSCRTIAEIRQDLLRHKELISEKPRELWEVLRETYTENDTPLGSRQAMELLASAAIAFFVEMVESVPTSQQGFWIDKSALLGKLRKDEGAL